MASFGARTAVGGAGMSHPPYSDLGFAKVDHARERRWGVPETVLGIGKTPDQIAAIVAKLAEHNSGAVLVTKTTAEAFEAVDRVVPGCEWHDTAKLIRLARPSGVVAGAVGIV